MGTITRDADGQDARPGGLRKPAKKKARSRAAVHKQPLKDKLLHEQQVSQTEPKASTGSVPAKDALRTSEELYRGLFKSMTEGFALHEIICDKKGKPCDYRFLEINPAFEELTGLKYKDVIGKTVREVLPDNDPQWVEIYGKVVLTGEPVQFDSHSTPLNKDYEVFAYSSAPRQFAVLFTDVTERKKRENQLHQLNRTLRALSKSSQAMNRWQEDEQAYLDAVCRIIVEDCGHKMVWIGYAEDDNYKSVRPVAYSGFEEGYLEKLKISWADVERGHGPTGTAIRTGKVSMCKNMLTDPKFKPWRKEALKRGYASSIVLPLKNVYKAFGALSIYSKEPDPFTEDEVKLLTGLANDLAFGITTIRLRASEKQAEDKLQERNEELAATNEELHTSNEELRNAQEKLAAQNAIQEGINRIFRKSMTCRTEEELGRTCLIVAEDITQSKFGFIGEINAKGRLDDIAISDPGWQACKMAIPKGHTGYRTVQGGFEIHGIYGRVISESKGFFTNEPASHPDSIGTPEGHPTLKAFLGVPLKQGEKTIGLVAVGNREGGYKQEDLEALEALSSAIVQAYMRFRAEEALRKSEQQNKFLADIITSASQAVGVGYPDGRLGMVNKAFEELTGYTAEELKSVDWAKTLTRMKWQKIEEEKLEELSRTGKPVRYEKEYIRKDGTVVPIELLVHLVKDTNGKPQYYYSFITDITERKRADEAIRKSESRYRSYVEVSGQFAWVTNAQGEIKEDTPYLRQFSGQTYEQAKGNGWAATLHPDDLPNTLQIWQEAVRTKQPYETEYRMRRHDGQYRYMLARGTPVFNNDGSVAEWVGVCIDITERKRQEEIMRQSEERLKRAQEIAHLGSWELDLVNNRLTWSDEVYQIFGLKPQEFAATYKAFLERVHPDDRAAVDAAYSDSLRENRKAYEIEHRVVRKDTSEIRIVHEKCEHFRDKTGKIVRSVGMVHDITDRREAQEALANERANLQTIFDAVDVGMLLISEDGSVKRVNNAVTRWIRKDPSAVGREQPGDILGCIHALDDPAGCGHALKCGTCPIRKAFESSLHSGEAVHDIEAQTVLSVDGRQMSLWLDVSADPVVIDGKRHVILSLNNITASKTAEAALRESELRERHRARELERLTNELEHKNEELESIIRIASHDLRSPLMNIKGFSGELSKDIGKVHQMLNEAQLSETVRGKVETVFTKYVPEAIGFIQTSADSINQMLRSLMQVAKAGTVPINVRDLDMNSIFATIAAHSKFKLSEINGRLEIEPLHGCRADADQMIQVFTNLVENAIKYREPTRPVQIRVYASAEPDKVTYCVEDNGKGIAAEHLDKVFNLFTRLDPEAARGEGLGLTIAKRMVERQGGMIWANSEVDKGSKFYVALPR